MSQLTGHLDADDKRQLLRTCRLVRTEVDSAVTVLDVTGASNMTLAVALSRFPCLDSLTLPCRRKSLLLLSGAQNLPLRLVKLTLTHEKAEDEDEDTEEVLADLTVLAGCAKLRDFTIDGCNLLSLDPSPPEVSSHSLPAKTWRN
ncbi:hypothetical protein FOA52_004867 [Chlamydomonas sp. UWO 241]|nr:hypothetical protein FOA52_004867 [Chlamydomonas sp. UWO 241]